MSFVCYIMEIEPSLFSRLELRSKDSHKQTGTKISNKHYYERVTSHWNICNKKFQMCRGWQHCCRIDVGNEHRYIDISQRLKTIIDSLSVYCWPFSFNRFLSHSQTTSIPYFKQLITHNLTYQQETKSFLRLPSFIHDRK